MEVNELNNINNIIAGKAQKCKEQTSSAPIKTDTPALENITEQASKCISQYGQAQVLIQNTASKTKLQQTPQSDAEIEELLNNIAQSYNMKVSYHYCNTNRAQIGRPVEGARNLCYDDKRVFYTKDENEFLKEIYIKDQHNDAIEVFNSDGRLIKEFTPEEMKTLKEYKYYPNAFHNFLRLGKPSYLPPQQELNTYINTLDNIFNDNNKVWTTQKPTKAYRALQSRLTDKQQEALSQIGEVFEDTSFVSTSQEKSTAKRFAGGNPILEIEIPENSRYIDMDAIFNIDSKRWNEQEFLLPRNSKFVVMGFEPDENIIKVKYLPD